LKSGAQIGRHSCWALRTVNGARYVWNAVSSAKTQTVLFAGQSNQHVTARWSELGK